MLSYLLSLFTFLVSYIHKEVYIMSQYELALVLNPNLSDDDLNSQFDSIKNMLEKSGASIEKIDNWGKKKLAYEIKKCNLGFFYFISFNSSANVPIELEAKLRITENVLRYLIIHKDV